MNKLQVLEEQIRKALPRLMELGEGVLLRDKITNQILKIIYLKKDRFSFVSIKTGDVSSNNLVKNIDEDFEIIGHDILLNDVLEWFQKFNKNNDVSFDLYGRFRIYNGNQYSQSTWNLFKPYLKDQSEKLIEFLYNLI